MRHAVTIVKKADSVNPFFIQIKDPTKIIEHGRVYPFDITI